MVMYVYNGWAYKLIGYTKDMSWIHIFYFSTPAVFCSVKRIEICNYTCVMRYTKTFN